MLLKTVAGSMLGIESAEPRVNGSAEGTGALADVPLALGAVGRSPLEESGGEPAAPFRGLDEAIPGAVPWFSVWPGLAAVWDSFGEAMKKYHTTPAKAHTTSTARSPFFISAPESEIGSTSCSGK